MPFELFKSVVYALAAAAIFVSTANAAPLIPLEDGTSWKYRLTQEAGEGYGFSGATKADESKVQATVVYRLAGKEDLDGRPLLKFEMHREGTITNTDFLTVDNKGINCWARLAVDGDTVRMDPPQTIVKLPLRAGTAWDFKGALDKTKIEQHYKIIGDEEVQVPAGKFRAFHIRGDQTAPNPTNIDRWVTEGVGIVKDVTTEHTADGALVRRITLELMERPTVAPRPEVKPPRRLTVAFGRDAVGETTDTFPADAEKICARWQGRGLREGAKIRAVWIAENVGDVAPADYAVDEATAIAATHEARGVFTLSRPEDGWAPGIYRVEFYVDDALAEAVKLKIKE